MPMLNSPPPQGCHDARTRLHQGKDWEGMTLFSTCRGSDSTAGHTASLAVAVGSSALALPGYPLAPRRPFRTAREVCICFRPDTVLGPDPD